jgi:hypothetical protein
MKKWEAWVIRKQYFKVQVEAEDWDTARDLVLEADVDIDNPDDIDWDVYDIEEVEA